MIQDTVQATLGEKLSRFEKLLADSVGIRDSELASVRAKIDTNHASQKEHLGYLEQTVGNLAEKHGTNLESLSRTQARQESVHLRHVQELQTHMQRVQHLEESVGGSLERASREVVLTRTQLDQMHSRLCSCENHGPSLSELTRVFENEALVSNEQQIILRDRVDYLESMFGDSTNKHSRTLEMAKEKIDQLHQRLCDLEGSNSALDELQRGHHSLREEKAVLHSHHHTLRERVDTLERLIGEYNDGHGQTADQLRAAHAKHAGELEAQHSH